MKRRILSILTALALCLGMCPVTAFAAEAETTTYIDADRSEKSASCTPLTSSDSSTTLQGGWYVVNGDVTISGTLVFNGETHLVLADGCKLTVKNIETTNLTIYGQSQGTGTLLAGGEYVTAPAIGYADPAGTSPKVSITINGGCVNAYSKTSIIAPYSLKRSVIGGYYSNTSANSVTINGGVVYTRDISAEGCSFPPKGPTIHNSIVGHNGVATVYGRAGLPDAGEIGFKAPNNLKSIYISSGATLTSLGKYKAYPIDMYDLPDDFEITLNGTINFASTEQEIRNAIRVTSAGWSISGRTGT